VSEWVHPSATDPTGTWLEKALHYTHDERRYRALLDLANIIFPSLLVTGNHTEGLGVDRDDWCFSITPKDVAERASFDLRLNHFLEPLDLVG